MRSQVIVELSFLLPIDYCTLASCSREYSPIHREPKTWFEAQAYCRERYTDLATINNAQDLNRVIDKMENNLYDFWIGLYEDVVTWRWSLPGGAHYGDGEAEFMNWDVGEPNEKRGVQHCVAIRHTGEWKDLDCDLLHYFLCFDGNVVENIICMHSRVLKYLKLMSWFLLSQFLNVLYHQIQIVKKEWSNGILSRDDVFLPLNRHIRTLGQDLLASFF